MLPSNPVSIGIPLGSSNRTLEVGSAHVTVLEVLLVLASLQRPVAEEPFVVWDKGKVYEAGKTTAIEIHNNY